MINHASILYSMGDAIGPFLKLFEEFPPAQKPEAFTVGDAFETMKSRINRKLRVLQDQ
jgi:hypothetical protein